MFTVKYKKRVHDRSLTKEQRERKAVRELADFWRQNPHVFVKDYMGIMTLAWWQEMWIYFMFKFPVIIVIATRGLGKK